MLEEQHWLLSYIVTVKGSNQFCDQLVEHKLLCHKNIHEVLFNDKFIIGLLKMNFDHDCVFKI